MSWTGYIPGDLVRQRWRTQTEDDMNAPTGMNTSLESPKPSAGEPSAPGGESVPSSSEIDASFLAAITALQRVTEVASKALAREDSRPLSLVPPMTLDPEAASLSTQRLMLFCGVIATIAGELCSIARIAPATAATGSSGAQASPESSGQGARLLHRTDPEPRVGSIVTDRDGDAWQRRDDNWFMSSPDSYYHAWDWQRLLVECGPVRLVQDGR